MIKAIIPHYGIGPECTASRHIKNIMIDTEIPEGKHRTAKGLRHAYGVNAVLNNISLNILQKWMGHATMITTAIYTNVIGEEEQKIASKM